MDEATLVEVLQALGLAIALSACAGLRAWLPLLLAGGLHRLGLLELGPTFGFLGSNRALVLFGIATLIEIAGDKIPAVDHGLDALSTVLRPAAGALLAASVLGRITDPLTAVALGVALGAPTAIVPHAAKSGLRALATTFTAGLANPVISLLEDLLAVVVFALGVLVPIVAALGLILLVAFASRRLWRRPRAMAHPA
jgi:Domain of unknown function (DUF4126)